MLTTWPCKHVADAIHPLSHNAGIVSVKHNMALTQLVAACTTHMIKRERHRGAHQWQFNIATCRLGRVWCSLALRASRTNSNNISQLHQLIFCLCFNKKHSNKFKCRSDRPKCRLIFAIQQQAQLKKRIKSTDLYWSSVKFSVLMRNHTVLPAIHTYIHKWNEPYLLSLSSHVASSHPGRYRYSFSIPPVVKVRGNAGERRSWAHKNCGRAFPDPTQALVVQTGCKGPFQLTVGPQIFSALLGPKFIL